MCVSACVRVCVGEREKGIECAALNDSFLAIIGLKARRRQGAYAEIPFEKIELRLYCC